MNAAWDLWVFVILILLQSHKFYTLVIVYASDKDKLYISIIIIDMKHTQSEYS